MHTCAPGCGAISSSTTVPGPLGPPNSVGACMFTEQAILLSRSVSLLAGDQRSSSACHCAWTTSPPTSAGDRYINEATLSK
eukprot:1161377-Pelagomonas_calceolata.AAC.2